MTNETESVKYNRIAVESVTEYKKNGGVAFATGILGLDNDIRMYTKAGVPTDGTSGTGAGVGGPGSLCVDYTNKELYMNEGTKASPAWGKVGAQS